MLSTKKLIFSVWADLVTASMFSWTNVIAAKQASKQAGAGVPVLVPVRSYEDRVPARYIIAIITPASIAAGHIVTQFSTLLGFICSEHRS